QRAMHEQVGDLLELALLGDVEDVVAAIVQVVAGTPDGAQRGVAGGDAGQANALLRPVGNGSGVAHGVLLQQISVRFGPSVPRHGRRRFFACSTKASRGWPAFAGHDGRGRAAACQKIPGGPTTNAPAGSATFSRYRYSAFSRGRSCAASRKRFASRS